MVKYRHKWGEIMERKKYEQLMGNHNDEKGILDYDFNMITGKVLKERRQRLGYSLETLSTKMNNLVTKQALSRYENGSARIKNNIFVEICYALKSTPLEIFSEVADRYFKHIDNDIETIIKRIEDK